MAQQNANLIAQKWADRLGRAADSVKNGVNSTTVSPTELAAQAKDRWIAGVQRAAEEGRFEEGLRSVSLSDWQKAMINKGIPNMQTGAREGVTKVEKFMRDFLPFAANVSETIKSMPKGTLQDSIARAETAIRMLAQYRKRR